MLYPALVALLSIVAGAVASVAGFGIGSILTPLLAVESGAQLAVALVAIPHFAGTLLRLVHLRAHVDRKVFLGFGLASALGGLVGALLHAQLHSRTLGLVFGCLLVFAGLTGVTGLSAKMRFGRRTAWIAGVLSGGFGGLVGNQGGIRSAALLGFDVRRDAFVATATAIGVVVDLARMPVYFATQSAAILASWRVVALAAAGVLLGTIFGGRLLRRIPEKAFKLVVSGVILALGVAVLAGVAEGAGV
jgi:uncharacterized membrane protein YfcA